MPKILVVCASNHGHTKNMAIRIAETVELAGVNAELLDVASAARVEPADYDAVIVGASVHSGHHQGEIVDWAKSHHATLNLQPSAFFSVCLTAADDTAESREATRGYVDEFLDQTRWTSAKTVTFAGALQYREYDFATRLVMRLMMRGKAGHPTDSCHDYDYTDWGAVERFARECVGMVRAEPVAAHGR